MDDCASELDLSDEGPIHTCLNMVDFRSVTCAQCGTVPAGVPQARCLSYVAEKGPNQVRTFLCCMLNMVQQKSEEEKLRVSACVCKCFLNRPT